MESRPLSNFQQFLEGFDELIEAAEAGGLDAVLTDYLQTIRERLIQIRAYERERLAIERRQAPRYEERRPARMVAGDYPVTILDQSVTGFGCLSPIPVGVDQAVRLEIDGEETVEIYECLVVRCHREGEAYRLGLELFSSLQIG